MVNFIYPTKQDLKIFISLIEEGDYPIKKYLPPVSKEWYKLIGESIGYVHSTSLYEGNKSVEDVCARLLYKIAKRHELGDGNKRSAVICVFIFCVLNDYIITDPKVLKIQAKRLAATKGRINEELMKNRVARDLLPVLSKIKHE